MAGFNVRCSQRPPSCQRFQQPGKFRAAWTKSRGPGKQPGHSMGSDNVHALETWMKLILDYKQNAGCILNRFSLPAPSPLKARSIFQNESPAISLLSSVPLRLLDKSLCPSSVPTQRGRAAWGTGLPRGIFVWFLVPRQSLPRLECIWFESWWLDTALHSYLCTLTLLGNSTGHRKSTSCCTSCFAASSSAGLLD